MIERIDMQPVGAPAPDTVPSGFPSLDRLLGGGFRQQDLIVLGGDVGAGNSSLALGVAMRVAGSGFPVSFISGVSVWKPIRSSSSNGLTANRTRFCDTRCHDDKRYVIRFFPKGKFYTAFLVPQVVTVIREQNYDRVIGVACFIEFVEEPSNHLVRIIGGGLVAFDEGMQTTGVPDRLA